MQIKEIIFWQEIELGKYVKTAMINAVRIFYRILLLFCHRLAHSNIFPVNKINQTLTQL